MRIQSGRLNQRIEIHRNESLRDGYGGTTPRFALYWSTASEVRPLSSARTLQANQEILKDGFSFLVRFRPDKVVTEGMQIKYRGAWLTITSCKVDYTYKEYMLLVGIWNSKPEPYFPPTDEDQDTYLHDMQGDAIVDMEGDYLEFIW